MFYCFYTFALILLKIYSQNSLTESYEKSANSGLQYIVDMHAT